MDDSYPEPTAPVPDETWLTPKQAAAALGIGVRRVNKLIQDERIPFTWKEGTRYIHPAHLTVPTILNRRVGWPAGRSKKKEEEHNA